MPYGALEIEAVHMETAPVDRESMVAASVRALEAEVETLHAIAGAILSIHDLEQVLLSVNDRLLSTLDADIAGAFLIDGDELVMQSCVGHRSMATARLRMRQGQGLAGLVFGTGEPHKVDDYRRDDTISRDFMALAADEKARSALAVPLRVRGDMTGVIEVWRRRTSVFTGEDIRRMQTMATLAAIAIDNARLYESQSAALSSLQEARAELEAQNDLLRRSTSLQRRLMELLLGRASLKELVRAGAEETNCGALATTVDGTALCSHPDELIADPSIGGLLARRAPTTGEPGSRGTFERLPDGRIAWEEPIRAGVEPVGSVFLIGRNRTPAFVETAVAQLAAVCGLHHLEEEAASTARAEAADDVLWDLLSDLDERRRQAIGKARRLHFDVDGMRRLVLGSMQDLSDAAEAGGWTHSQADRMRQWIVQIVREACRHHGVVGSARDNRVVVIAPDDAAACRTLIDDMTERLAPIGESLRIAWGISATCADCNEMPGAYEQARAACESGRRLRSGTALAYDELGVVRLLVGASVEGDIDAYVDDVLGPLSRYDRERNGSLIQTLQAFFEAGCSQKDAAARLYVHPKTLRYRLERVRELAGLDLNIHADRVRADLALQIHQIRSGTTDAAA